MRPWFFHVFVVLLGLALPASSQQSQLASEIVPQSGYAPDAGVLSVHVSGFGLVISTDQQQTVFCQATCDTFLGTGTSVVLKATPQPGYHFAGWSGACSGIGNCNVTLAAAQTVSATFAVGAAQASNLHFVPATPCRIADTRNPAGPFGGPFLSAQTVRGFTIPSSACNIPATAQAYSLNVTVVPHTVLGFLTTFPCGQAQPLASTLNSDGRIKAVAAIVPAGTNGDVCFFVTHDTELVLDIDGYFVPDIDPASLAFFPVTPCRLVDTRLPAGPLGGPSLVGNAARTFPLLSSPCNLPATVRAYSLNYTSVPKGVLGFLTTWPGGQLQPLVSTLNAVTGAVTANAAIVPAGTNGDVSVFVTHSSDLVIDVNGYFAPPDVGGLSLFNLSPCRVIDTRNPAGSPPFNGLLNVDVGGSPCGSPSAARSYVLNATVVPPAPLGFLTLWPQGATQPLVSTLNAADGAVTSNMAIVPTTNGSISAFGSNATHLVLDISGYFAPSTTIPISVSVVPASVTLSAGATQAFTATVTNDPSNAVTWEVNGVVGGNSTFGTIDTAGNYTAPAAPATAPISVTAVSQADPFQSASATVNVNFSNASLAGDYVFLVTVGDTNQQLGNAPGFSFAAGRFHADGKGILSAGVEDSNTLNQAAATNISFTGAYTVGADGRGTATITTAAGSTPLRFALTSGERGQVIEFDGAFAASGFVLRQDPAAIANVTGTYVFSLFGDSAGSPLGIIGRLTADGAGNLTGAEVVNAGGTFTETAAINGTYTVGAGGRGLATVTSALATQHFAFYIASANTIQFIDIDPPTVAGRSAGTAYQQANTGFSKASLGSSAFVLSGTFILGGAFTAVGRFDTDGAGSLNGVADFDSSSTLSSSPISGGYSVGADGLGGFTLTTTGPASTGFDFWMISDNQAVILQRNTIPAARGVVSTGLLFRRQPGTFTNAQFQGNYAFALQQMNVSTAQAASGQITADGIGALTGTEDLAIPPSPDLSLTGTWSIATNGRGAGSLAVELSPSPLVFYPISPAEIIFMVQGAVGLAEKQCSDCH